MHVHVLRDGIDAKFWLWPTVKLAFNARVVRELTEIIVQRRNEIARAWDDFFGEG